jgi:hypothetical protein
MPGASKVEEGYQINDRLIINERIDVRPIV